MKAERILWSGAMCLVPWIAVALVILVTAHINRVIDLHALSFEAYPLVPVDSLLPSTTDLAAISKHLLSRVAWGVSAIGFALVAVTVVITSILIVTSSFRTMQRDELVRHAALVAVGAIGVLLLIATLGEDVMTEPRVTSDLRIATMHRTPATLAVSTDTYFDSTSAAVFLLLIAAASATLSLPRDAALTADALADRIKQNQWLLYFGAAALVIRAIEMYMLYRWPSIWFPNEKADEIERMALALSTAHGAFFSAILMALYLPTALIMRLRTRSLAAQAVAGTSEQPEAWTAKVGLASSPFKEVANVIAAIAPLLAGGSISKVISVFGA